MAKERWASRLGLVLAMAGNAVGLGNFLRFPAEAAANGGGAFLIPYIVSLIVLGLPLMWVEWTMGRFGGQFGHHSSPGSFQAMGQSRLWKYFGALGLWSCLCIAAFYLYIESWCMAYAGHSLFNGFSEMDQDGVKGYFNWLTGQQDNQILAVGPAGMIIFFACISINIAILSQGLARGIELVAKVAMPLLMIFGAILAVRGLMLEPGVDKGVDHSPFEGLNFVWQPTFTSLSDPKVWLAAAGQIFFTLSIGMGSIHCYASYLREQDDVALTGATTAWTNEFCEVVLGSAILIPIAVAYLGLQEVRETGGFQMGFFVFPTLFNNWGAFAPVAGFMWFGLLFFAAITSSLAMGQPMMSLLQEEFGMNRHKSALVFGLLVLSLALPVALTHQDVFFSEFNYWAGTVMLVVFALSEAILFGWVFGMNRGWNELNRAAQLWVPPVFYYIIKYVTPVFLIVILAAYTFEPKAGWTEYIQKPLAGEKVPDWEWSGGGLIGKLQHNDIETQIEATRSDAKLTEEKRSERILFLEDLKMWHDIDRLVMVAVFIGLSLIVHLAWRKRRREGRA